MWCKIWQCLAKSSGKDRQTGKKHLGGDSDVAQGHNQVVQLCKNPIFPEIRNKETKVQQL